MNLKNKNKNFLTYSDLNYKISAKRLKRQAKKSNLFKNIYSFNKNDLDESFTRKFPFLSTRIADSKKLYLRYFLGLI